MKISHIINPVSTSEDSRFHFIQQVTFQSMQTAKLFAEEATNGNLSVEFFSAQYAEDHNVVPAGFVKTPNLTKSILDYIPDPNGRKLPLLIDIIERLYQASDSDYMVYTNVDIALMPNFYLYLFDFIEKGFDCFTINRRTISNNFQSVSQLPEMYKEGGQPHRGWDCFVFPRHIVPGFRMGEVCIGAPYVGLLMLSNLLAFGTRFSQVVDEHLTFHLGNDRNWRKKTSNLYLKHNKSQTYQLLLELSELIGGFPPNCPPGKFIKNHQDPLRSWIYDRLRSIYIPYKLIKPFKKAPKKN